MFVHLTILVRIKAESQIVDKRTTGLTSLRSEPLAFLRPKKYAIPWNLDFLDHNTFRYSVITILHVWFLASKAIGNLSNIIIHEWASSKERLIREQSCALLVYTHCRASQDMHRSIIVPKTVKGHKPSWGHASIKLSQVDSSFVLRLFITLI